MVDVIVYKPSPNGLVFIHDKPLGFMIYHIKHERVCVSYIKSALNASQPRTPSPSNHQIFVTNIFAEYNQTKNWENILA